MRKPTEEELNKCWLTLFDLENHPFLDVDQKLLVGSTRKLVAWILGTYPAHATPKPQEGQS